MSSSCGSCGSYGSIHLGSTHPTFSYIPTYPFQSFSPPSRKESVRLHHHAKTASLSIGRPSSSINDRSAVYRDAFLARLTDHLGSQLYFVGLILRGGVQKLAQTKCPEKMQISCLVTRLSSSLQPEIFRHFHVSTLSVSLRCISYAYIC